MTSESTPNLLPLIFLHLVQRAGDRAVSLGVYYIAVFVSKELLVYNFYPLNKFIEGDNNSRSFFKICWHSISGTWAYFISLLSLKYLKLQFKILANAWFVCEQLKLSISPGD